MRETANPRVNVADSLRAYCEEHEKHLWVWFSMRDLHSGAYRVLHDAAQSLTDDPRSKHHPLQAALLGGYLPDVFSEAIEAAETLGLTHDQSHRYGRR